MTIITFKSSHSNLIASNGFEDYGIVSIMYHRFNESKYPSTNIQLDVFKNQLKIIESENIQFIHPKDFGKKISQNKQDRKVLLTIDDGLLSFYQNHIMESVKEPY